MVQLPSAKPTCAAGQPLESSNRGKKPYESLRFVTHSPKRGMQPVIVADERQVFAPSCWLWPRTRETSEQPEKGDDDANDSTSALGIPLRRGP